MSFNIENHKELTQITTHQDTALGIMKWGNNNSFPKTLENLIKQSPSAYPAIKRTSNFYRGSSFEGENEVVNTNGLTLKKVVAALADDYALYKAFAIQCNFNIKQEVTSISPMRIADLRFSEFDELNNANKIGYFFNFGNNSEIRKTIQSTATKNKIKWFNRFNPDSVLEQINNTEGKVSNYLGQILYHSDEGHSSYPIPPLQPAINFVLSDIENSILVRKETSTGFISSYLLKTSLDSEDPTLIAIENAIESAQGARGTGKVITFSGLSPEDLQATLLEEIGGGSGARAGIINSARTAYELDKEVISNAYLIPPALAGVDQKTGFSGADLEEAYFVYNAITKDGRSIIEAELNRVLEASVFKTKSIKINKLKLDVEEDEAN